HLVHGYEAVHGFDIVHDHTILGPIYSSRYPGLHVVTTNHGPFNPELSDLYGAIADDGPIIAISHDQAGGAGGRGGGVAADVPIIAISHRQAGGAGDLRLAAVIHHGIDPEMFPVGEGQGD